jgi:hypothetical protein
MKGSTPEDFLKYVRSLEFTEFEDMIYFVRQYLDAYMKTPDDDKEAIKDAYLRYSIVAVEFMPSLLIYTEEALELRKLLYAKLASQVKH